MVTRNSHLILVLTSLKSLDWSSVEILTLLKLLGSGTVNKALILVGIYRNQILKKYLIPHRMQTGMSTDGFSQYFGV